LRSRGRRGRKEKERAAGTGSPVRMRHYLHESLDGGGPGLLCKRRGRLEQGRCPGGEETGAALQGLTKRRPTWD